MKIIAILLAITLFALVPIFASWQWDFICAIEILIIGTIIASHYSYNKFTNNGRRNNILTKSKGKHQMHQGS